MIQNMQCVYNGPMEGCQLKYILKATKGKVLASTLLLLLVKDGFLKSSSQVYLKFDHVFNLLFYKQPEKHGST